MHPNVPRKVRRSQSWWALLRLGPFYHKILRPPLLVGNVCPGNFKWAKIWSLKFETHVILVSSFSYEMTRAVVAKKRVVEGVAE